MCGTKSLISELPSVMDLVRLVSTISKTFIACDPMINDTGHPGMIEHVIAKVMVVSVTHLEPAETISMPVSPSMRFSPSIVIYITHV